MKTLLMIIVTAATLASLSVQAKVSTKSELRGYNACVEASQPQFKGLTLTRTYYLQSEADRNVFYINGSAWENGSRVKVRISCDASNDGRTLFSHNTGSGRYALQVGADRIQVATQ